MLSGNNVTQGKSNSKDNNNGNWEKKFHAAEASTKILQGIDQANEGAKNFWNNARVKVDIVADLTWPFIVIKENTYRKAIRDAINRGVKVRVVIEVTKDNLRYCNEIMGCHSSIELWHRGKTKGNFGVSEKEWIAVVDREQSKQQRKQIIFIIYSNAKEIVEQQQSVFDAFLSNSIPAKQRIREIE